MASTPILDLEEINTASTPSNYDNRLEEDRATNSNDDKLDVWAGSVTASFCERFWVSGTLSQHLGEYYGGLVYNDRGPRVITKVLAFTRNSGSGGVTRVDVRKNNALPTANESLFANNVFKCIVSASAGNLSPQSTTTFAAGSSSWNPGQFLGVVLDTVVDGPATDLTVHVYWKPSASYGAG